MSVVSPQPNPDTVAALLDTTWRVAEAESARTDALDRKAATVASFASLVVALTSTVGASFIERFDTWRGLALLLAGLGALVAAASLAVWGLFPREYQSLGIAYLKRFPTWSEIRKSPEQIRGDTMKSLVEAISRERELNDRKAGLVRWSFVLLLGGLALIASEAATLATRVVTD